MNPRGAAKAAPLKLSTKWVFCHREPTKGTHKF